MNGEAMRIAHVSDVHLTTAAPVDWRGLLGKRLTGWVNLRVRRAKAHDDAIARVILNEIRAESFAHLVVSGDWVNLSLESELEAAVRMFERECGVPASQVTMIPGNHDAYTREAERARWFAKHFDAYLVSQLPELCAEHASGRFPVVKLAGQAAFIGLSSAVARPPFVASGRIGRPQLAALARVLAHPEVRSRLAVIAVHHPPFRLATAVKQATNGLEDAEELWECLDVLERGLVLHGHLHRRLHRSVTTKSGTIDVLGAGSASLDDTTPARRAGYNVYEVVDGRLKSVVARVFEPASGKLVSRAFAQASVAF